MTRVDFYVLTNPNPNSRHVLAARLTEKAYKLGHKIFIHTSDLRQAQNLDALLWTFRDGAFLPHCLDGDENDRFAPIHIGSGGEPHSEKDLLINLSDQVPLFFSQFQRTAEIVCGDQRQTADGRVRFKFYKDRGYKLEVHKI